MNKNLTDITLVIDRSGSMLDCKREAENGVNHFVEDQKNQDGECLFSLVQFDTEYEFVHNGVDIQKVGKFALVPRGMTALLDAVGRAINETGERLSKMDEAKRPGLVIFVIVTDGHENSSHEFKRDQIKKMIERQQKDYNWQFTFLGANQDAFAEAQGMGIPATAASNYAPEKTTEGLIGASLAVGRARTARSAGAPVSMSYTTEERKSMEK